MATLDDSPSVYSGQSWSTWAEKVPLGEEDDPDEDEPSNVLKEETNSMKLRKEDLPLFGYCPAQDELYLVVCEKCGQVVKPQALKTHLEKRHGSKDSSSHHVSPRLHSRGSNHGGVTSHRSSPQLQSSKSGIKQSCATSVKVDRTISDTVKMTSVEVTLKRLPQLVKSQISPNRCNLTANSISNGAVKSTANGPSTTSTDSSPSSTAPSSGSGLFCASLVNNTSPLHNMSHKPSTPPFSSFSSTKHVSGLGRLPDSPNSNCVPSLERTSERDKNSDSSTSVKTPQSGCLSKNSSTSSTSLAKSSPVSKSPSVKMKHSPSYPKTSAPSNSVSNKPSSSSVKTSSSPSKCSSSPVKNSNSPARSALSPAKSAPSPAKSAPSPSPIKSAPSPAKSPSKSASSPSHCSTSSTPRRSSKVPKEKKFILCRDREFDPNVHCGVIRPDDGRHCTRSLTCKTHALSLRRGVLGRRKDFDELLKEHRANKEALLKAVESEKLAAAGGLIATVLSPNPPTPDATTKLTSFPDQSVPSGSPMSSLSHKHLHPLSIATTKALKLSSKPVNSHHPRSGSSGLHSPPWFKEEMSPPSEVFSRLSSDGEIDTEDFQEKGDNPYISHHPRPISTCTFGGRCASGGWYLFNRKKDFLRSAFLSALEKHLHPPPHKKLCVESKLPKEPQLHTNSMDPYEFNIVDMSAGSSMFNQNVGVVNSVNKTQPVKQKSKPATSRSHKSKGDNCTSPRAGQASFPNSPSPTGSHGAPLKRKRSSSGAGNSTLSPNIAALPNVSIQNTVLGNISLTTPIATCIPSVNVNLSSNTLSRFNVNASLFNASKAGQFNKNNLIKDASGNLNLLLATNMEQRLNGQYMNISGNVLEMAASQTGLHLEEKQTSSSKRSRSGGGTSKQNSNRQLSTSTSEGLCPIPNNIMANITQKAFLVDKTMLAPAVTSFSASSVVSLANCAMSPPQASPAAIPSPFYRSGSISPQVSAASPTPNGVISPVNMKTYSLSAFNHITNQMTASPPTSRNSTPSPNISHDSPTTHFTFIGQSPSSSGSHKSYNSKAISSYRSTNHPPGVLPTSVTFSTGAQSNLANNLHNLCVTNAANISSLPLKGSSIGKNIPIPVPFTLPLTMASNLTNQPTATLYVTSDNVQLQQTSSSHSNVIS